jgi:probable phosphoglycerate mutase
MKTVTFVRHAESAANAAGIWNGRSDGPLSETGLAQLDSLGKRFSASQFDVVVSSPLGRAQQTAASFADDVVIDDGFTELDLGRWEGSSGDEVRSRDGEALQSAVSDKSQPFGDSGESLDQGGRRIAAAVDRLVESMPDGGSAAVVTHGGLLQTYLNRFLPGDGHRVHAFVNNTSITRIKVYNNRPRLAVFNDTGHLGPLSVEVKKSLESGEPVLALVRHGRTRANVEQRWQGQRDWDLDELGYVQAQALAEYYGQWGTVFSSPLQRAHHTANHLASGIPTVVEDLQELNMGRWEDLTSDEIDAQFPGVLESIYQDGKDLPRGETGETWAQLTTRFRSAIDAVSVAEGEPTVIVAHGGAIRAYISSLTATKDTHAESLYTVANTSVSHVALTPNGPMILDYSVAPHIEGLDVVG